MVGVGLSSVKNIIFDLGGVLLNLDVNRTCQQLAALGGMAPERVKYLSHTVSFFAEYETGFITSAEFRACLRKHLNTVSTDEQLDEAWNAMLLDFPKEKISLLQKLSANHRLFLLSNTNEIHWQAFTARLRQMGVHDFDAFFERAYYSHKLGMRKPDLGIFRHIVGAHQLMPEETLFIDDTLANVQAAHELGLVTVHLTHPDQLFEILQ